jgi:cytochrome d ubiquinol oxidase subunit II
MNSADWLLVVLMAALTAYALFGGADFGAGFWDLFAGGATTGARQRKLIEHAIGPVWEANHVWLIFTIVLLWTGFPTGFAAIAATCYIPLTIAALGIIGRGAGFAFRKISTTLGRQRLFGAGFAFSSIVTPFFLGTVIGGVADGRIPAEVDGRHIISAWWNPTSVATGVLAVAVCAYLAALFLTRDAERHEPSLVETLRRRALWTGLVVGILAIGAIFVVRVSVNIPLVVVSVVAGTASLVLLWFRRFVLVRVSAGLAAAAVIWAWGAGQYPYLLPGEVTVEDAAAPTSVLHVTLGAVVVGVAVLIPSLWWLFSLFQSTSREAASETEVAAPGDTRERAI